MASSPTAGPTLRKWLILMRFPPQFVALPKRYRHRVWSRVYRRSLTTKLLRPFLLTLACELAMMLFIQSPYRRPASTWAGLVLHGLATAGVFFICTILFVRYAVKRLRQELLDEITKRCLECQYDLTGNVSGVCPECGLPIFQYNSA